MIAPGQIFELAGKTYKVDKVIMYGGRLMVCGFRWIKSTQKFSSVSYVLCTPDQAEACNIS